MKKILFILLFLPLLAYGTDPLSWGVKGGGGSTDTTSLSNRIDSKVDTSLIITGQEALDSLSANIGRIGEDFAGYVEDAMSLTKFGVSNYDRAINETFNTNYIGGTLDYESTTGSSSLTDGIIQWIACEIKNDTVAIGVEVVNPAGTAGSFTGNNFNGIALYSYSGGTVTKIATTTNNEDIWKVPIASKDTFLFTTEVPVSVGVYWIGLVYNDAGSGTAPQLMRQYRSQADFNFNNTDYFNSYSSGATLPSSFDISTATKSNNSYQIKIIGKGHLE